MLSFEYSKLSISTCSMFPFKNHRFEPNHTACCFTSHLPTPWGPSHVVPSASPIFAYQLLLHSRSYNAGLPLLALSNFHFTQCLVLTAMMLSHCFTYSSVVLWVQFCLQIISVGLEASWKHSLFHPFGNICYLTFFEWFFPLSHFLSGLSYLLGTEAPWSKRRHVLCDCLADLVHLRIVNTPLLLISINYICTHTHAHIYFLIHG